LRMRRSSKKKYQNQNQNHIISYHIRKQNPPRAITTAQVIINFLSPISSRTRPLLNSQALGLGTQVPARPHRSSYSSTTRSPRDPYGHVKPNQRHETLDRNERTETPTQRSTLTVECEHSLHRGT
jgi:hypothetical protein